MNKSIFQFIHLSFIFILFSSFSSAEEPFQTIVVTATRTAQTIDDSLAAVTVITRQDIEHSQVLTVPELLRSVPGLDISNSGGLGKQTSVFMRGTKTAHVLVLIDGVKIGSATLGTASFEHLPLSQIERIEIVRGPRSSLYGSEAIGGVIQIFTRKGKGKPKVHASFGAGSESTYQATTGLSGAAGPVWYSLMADHLRTDGFNACQGNESSGCFTIEPDEDGYENTSFSARLGSRLGENLMVETHALHIFGNTQYDSSFDNEADFLQQIIGLKADYDVSERWVMSLNVANTLDEIDNFGNNSSASHFYTDRTTASVVNNWLFSETNILTIGYDYQTDEVESSTAYTVDSRDNHGVFTEYQTQWGKIDLIVGLRNDDNEQFGNHATGNLGLGYALTPKTRLFASYGTAFKAPTFNELYFPDFGNPNLVPEESDSFEIGLLNRQATYQWSLNVYHTQIEKLIATYFDAATGDFFAANLNEAKITGVEGAFNWQQSKWEFNGQFSWLKPEDEMTGHLLPRRAEQTVNLELAESRGPARVGINFFAQSHRYDDSANTQRVGGYGIFNLTSEYHFTKQWALRFRLENLLDKEYQTASFYNTPGRTWFVSFHYQPKE